MRKVLLFLVALVPAIVYAQKVKVTWKMVMQQLRIIQLVTIGGGGGKGTKNLV